jgi:hypothetical protein
MWHEPLPRHCEPVPGESGMGFCLRAAALNGYNLHWLRSAAGVPYGKSLTRHRAGRVAAILGCPRDWLGAGLTTPERLHGRTTFTFLGQRFSAGNRLRRRRPQVCPRCVHRDGFCRAIWELGLVTACGLHRCALIDLCAACNAPLRWDRSDVAACHCGRPISSVAARACSEEPSFVWSQMLEAKLAGDAVDKMVWTALGLPDLLHELSTDGLLAVLHAFGACTGPYSRIAPSASTRSLGTCEWADVTVRAWSRLQELRRRSEGQWRQLAPVVSPGMLGGLAQYATTTPDAAVATQLLRSLFGTAEASRCARDLRQWELFD